MSIRCAAALAFFCLAEVRAVAADQSNGLPPDEAPTRITDFDQPFDFSYLAFEKTATVADGAAHIVGKTGQGGAGVLKQVDLSEFADYSPAIWMKVGPRNRAKAIKMFFVADEVKRMFSYSLENVGPDDYARVLPENGLALSPAVAGEPDQTFNPAKITMFQVQGDWTGDPVDVLLDKIELVPPTPEMRAQRKAHTEQLAKAAERKRREERQRREEIERLVTGAPHPEDGPKVTQIGAVKRDTIAVTIDAREILLQTQMPLEPKEGVEIRPEKNARNVLCLEDGQIVDVPKGRDVLEQVEGQRKPLGRGKLVVNHNLVSPGPVCRGTPLTVVTVQEPRAYRILSNDDPAYARPRQPAAVHVKAKPTGQASGEMSIRYHVYLTLPSPLQEHAKYTIRLIGVNTRQSEVAYTHAPRRTRSEAIHVTQIGYRPNDPFKRAYLSLWMGTGGAVEYETDTFEIIDAGSRESVYSGKISGEFPAGRVESLRGNKNHTQTNVYYLDFHDFCRPGEYVVFVPGIGVSYPFRIDDGVWRDVFKTSMHGFLSHRSGIKLGPPFTKYVRPRPMHPDDGVKVFQLDVTFWNGEADSVERCLRRLVGPELDAAKLKTRHDAWGGYMDAGDWDRRSQHLTATWLHLELLDLFPEFFEKTSLTLPPNEANDRLPDVLNEALWNLEFYRRLQGPDGGVGGGVESTSHPRPGEASWQESLLLGAFAPDPETSLRYAACAARAGRLLGKYDPARAREYAESARRAWTWTEANAGAVIARECRDPDSRRGKDEKKLQETVRNMRALAAVELYRLTGDAKYHDAFRRATDLSRDGGDPGKQLESIFAYAVLPDELVDSSLKTEAIAWFEEAARDSIAFTEGNPFSVTCRVPMLPVIGYVGYYSVPETSLGAILPRAHYLTGKDEYLRGAVAAAQFSAGANPMNMTFTTGVGCDYPREPLHVDSQHAGIDPPEGITVYGMSDPAVSSGAVDWAHTWYLGKSMIPGSRTWPTSEAYADLGNWPAMTEYTVHQTFGPTSFYWGYLAARK